MKPASLISALSLALLLFALAASGLAGTGGTIILPSGRPTVNGVVVEIDTRWVNGTGYRPVLITAKNTAGPLAYSREFRLELTLRDWSWQNPIRYVTHIEIPAGAASATITAPIFQDSPWNAMELTVYEGGSKLPEFEGWQSTAVAGATQFAWSETRPSILVIDPNADSRAVSQRPVNAPIPATVAMWAAATPAATPADATEDAKAKAPLLDVRGLASLLPNDGSLAMVTEPFKQANNHEILNSLNSIPYVDLLPPEDLPDNWLCLTCADVIVISLEELSKLRASREAEWLALRRWLSAGGALCVFGVGGNYERLADLERTLALPPLDQDGADEATRGWRRPDRSQGAAVLDSLLRSMGSNSTAMSATSAARSQAEAPADPASLFAWREVELGRVAALTSDNPFPGSPAQWEWLLGSLGAKNWAWGQRHGMSMHRANMDYWSFLVPGVGTPPVALFLVLISLFVVLIGPVNYVLLSRVGRLYLLMITVPLGAALATASLFGYALLGDGLGVKVRTRSFTHIDQRRGEAVSWSRQSYYAGMAPMSGLAFPTDTAVYPLLETPSAGLVSGNAERHIHWGDRQGLVRGYIASRVVSQFMVVQPQKTESALDVRRRPGGAWQATNRLGATILQAAVSDDQGRLWWAERQEDGATFELRSTTLAEAISKLRDVHDAQKLRPPETFDPFARSNSSGIGRSIYRWQSMQVDIGQAPPSAMVSILERSLQAALDEAQTPLLQPGAFLAIVDRPAEVPYGVARFEPVETFHLVSGRWLP